MYFFSILFFFFFNFRYHHINSHHAGFEISSLSGWESIVVQGYGIYENYCDVAYCEDFLSASEYSKRNYPTLKNGKVDPVKAMFSDRGSLVTRHSKDFFLELTNPVLSTVFTPDNPFLLINF